jgi:hypothetical protein
MARHGAGGCTVTGVMPAGVLGPVTTRRDRATGQPLYDYRLRKTYTSTGRFMGRDRRRYKITIVIVHRYEVA